MLNFDFLEKRLGIVSLPHFPMIFQEKCFSCDIILADRISLSDCLYFLKYWANLKVEREAIIPTFAKVNISIKSGGYKLKKKIPSRHLLVQS